MPNPPWPITRLTLREDLADQFRAKTAVQGADSSDVLELLITAFVGQEPEASRARDALDDIEDMRAVSVVDAPLPPGSDVAVLRMGPYVAENQEVEGGYRRSGRGAGLAAPPAEAWAAGRGYWRLAKPGPKHLVLVRLGVVLGVFRVDSWAEADSGRLWADTGYLVDPATRSLRHLGRTRKRPPTITEEDLAVLDAFCGVTVTYPLDRRGSAVYRLDDFTRARRSRASRRVHS